jgi:hypothetical protein
MPPTHLDTSRASTRSATRSQPRNLLSIARLNIAKSRERFSIAYNLMCVLYMPWRQADYGGGQGVTRPDFAVLAGPEALTMHGAASGCVADEIGKILLANLAELRCTAIEAGQRPCCRAFAQPRPTSAAGQGKPVAMQQTGSALFRRWGCLKVSDGYSQHLRHVGHRLD